MTAEVLAVSVNGEGATVDVAILADGLERGVGSDARRCRAVQAHLLTGRETIPDRG